MNTIEKQATASHLRSMIAYYTELTVNEHLSQKATPEADEAWNDILNLINQLVEA